MTARLADRLREAAAALETERVSVGGLLQMHGPAAQGSLLLMLAVPCLLPIPGTGTVLGLGVLAMAVAMWRGQADAALPRRVCELEMSRNWARRVLATLAAIHSLAGRVARVRAPRLLPDDGRAWLAGWVGAMAVVLILPIPFGNVLPAVALVLIGTGLAFRDGVLVLVGSLTAASTVALMSALLFAVAGWGTQWAGQLLV